MTIRTRHDEQPEKVFDSPITRKAQVRLYDKVCFGLGALGALWLAVLLTATTPRQGWSIDIERDLNIDSVPGSHCGRVAGLHQQLPRARRVLLTVDLFSPKATDWTNR